MLWTESWLGERYFCQIVCCFFDSNLTTKSSGNLIWHHASRPVPSCVFPPMSFNSAQCEFLGAAIVWTFFNLCKSTTFWWISKCHQKPTSKQWMGEISILGELSLWRLASKSEMISGHSRSSFISTSGLALETPTAGRLVWSTELRELSPWPFNWPYVALQTQATADEHNNGAASIVQPESKCLWNVFVVGFYTLWLHWGFFPSEMLCWKWVARKSSKVCLIDIVFVQMHVFNKQTPN